MSKNMPRDMEFFASTDAKGVVRIKNRSLFDDYFREYPNSIFVIKISKVREKHDAEIRAFYWAARVVPCMQALNQLGYNMDREEVHLMIKEECPMMHDIITLPTGKTTKRIRSMGQECDTQEVSQLIEFVEQWGAENLHIKWD